MTAGPFVSALLRERALLRETMFQRIGSECATSEEQVYMARYFGILPGPSGRTSRARTALWMLPPSKEMAAP